MPTLEQIAEQFRGPDDFLRPRRLGAPNGYIARVDPMVARCLERLGYDPEEYRLRMNETTRRHLATDALHDGVDAIDAEYTVIEADQ